MRPLLRWYRGRVVILGDAAHGMLPHHGQGANTSIEDAFALGALLAEAKGADFETALAQFQALRRSRTRKIQRSSWVTNSLLHLHDGPGIPPRDERMARVVDDFSWIHEYDVQEALRTAGVEPARVTPDARLDEDLGIDSLRLVDLIVAAEDRFGLVIADDDWSRFRTVGDIAAHLSQVATLPR